MDLSFRIPDTDGPEIVVRRPALGSLQVLADGVKAKRVSRRKLIYRIPQRDGTTKDVELAGQWRGFRALVDGHDLPLERQLSVWEVGLIVLPLALIAIGGLIGAVFAAIGLVINRQLVRRVTNVPVKIGATVAVLALVAAGWLGTAFLVAPLRTVAVGECVNGVTAAASKIEALTKVDCSRPHDAEIVGETRDGSNGVYPGTDPLIAVGTVPCTTAFAAYVGRSVDDSSLALYVVVPDDLRWAKGDRRISCVALDLGGAKLTSSVKASGR